MTVIELADRLRDEADAYKFVELCVSRSMHNMISAATTTSHVFFDRSIVDNVNGLQKMPGGAPAHLVRAMQTFRYARKVNSPGSASGGTGVR